MKATLLNLTALLRTTSVALAGVQQLLKQNQELKAENENMKTITTVPTLVE